VTQIVDLDAEELTAWLTRVTQTIDRSLRDTLRAEAVEHLRRDYPHKVGLPILAQLALLDDCLRVAHVAIETDGIIETEELERVSDLVRLAAPKYFAVLAPYESFDEGPLDLEEVARFLAVHRSDTGAFGYSNPSPWRGLALARLVERHAHNAAARRDLERMLVRIMDGVFAGRNSDSEKDARRVLRELFEPAPANTGDDPRAIAFCRADAPEVFSSVAHGSQVHARDPFDVES
jgi:hypothetical protein